MSQPRSTASSAGFTLVEVLIALAITAFVAAAAYTGLATVIDGVASTRLVAERSYELNRAMTIIARDLRHFTARPIRDEFGDQEPALTGGSAARFLLSFTRNGWHNPNDLPRSELQRVNYLVEEGALWRESYPVLDRTGDIEPQRVLLLSGVEALELGFLDAATSLRPGDRGTEVDTRDWVENWVPDSSAPGAVLAPPVAVELELQLEDLGIVTRLYELPPL